MNFSKLSLSILTGLLSTGLLFGCGQVEDEQEPDPTEEPSEQQDQNELENETNQ